MRDVKERAHLTNAYVAEKAEVSTKTIERIMALNYDQDIMRGTARRIELAIIGPVGKHLCDIDFDDRAATDKIAALLAEVEHLQKENDRYTKIIDKYIG